MSTADGARKIRVNGWRQGSCLKTLDHERFPSSLNLLEPARLVLVSQDCDLVNESYDAEPMVEAIVAVPLDGKPDGNLTYGKNPRKLQISFLSDGNEAWCQVNVAGRCFLTRSILEDISPDSDWVISPHGCDILARWLANRYRRGAFPDAFNDRLKNVQSRINRALKKQGIELSGIYLRLNTSDELPVSGTYKVILVGLMEEVDYVVSEKRDQVEGLIETLKLSFQTCSGIEVVDAMLVSEQDFTVAQLRVFKNWNYDAITMKSPDDTRLPPI